MTDKSDFYGAILSKPGGNQIRFYVDDFGLQLHPTALILGLDRPACSNMTRLRFVR